MDPLFNEMMQTLREARQAVSDDFEAHTSTSATDPDTLCPKNERLMDENEVHPRTPMGTRARTSL